MTSIVGTEVVHKGKSPLWPVGFGESFMEDQDLSWALKDKRCSVGAGKGVRDRGDCFSHTSLFAVPPTCQACS